ncbi:MAG: hypothetical protein ACR2IR_01130, partial [Acidimicrobiia bacterium]
MHPTPTCKYMSRVIDLPVDDAAAAFHAWTRDARGDRLDVVSGSLRIDRITNGSAFPGHALGPVARAYGWVRTRTFAFARVEIELSAWWSTQSGGGVCCADPREDGRGAREEEH